jgi:hypothetical protein
MDEGHDQLRYQSGVVRWGRIGTVAVAWLFAAGVALQVFLAGIGTFDNPARWVDHVHVGQWIGSLTILLLILAVVGRASRLVIALSALVLVLYGMQYPLANTDVGSMAALHAVNALALFWLSMEIATRTRPLLATSDHTAEMTR